MQTDIHFTLNLILDVILLSYTTQRAIQILAD